MKNIVKVSNLKIYRSAAVAAVLYVFALQAGVASATDLEECIKAALQGNPGIQASSYRAEAARGGVKQAESAWYPQVGLSSTYARTDNPPQAFMMKLNQRQLTMDGDFNNPDPTANVRSSAGLQMRVLDARRGLGIDIAETVADAVELQSDAYRNEVAYQVTRAYYGVLQAKAFVNVQEESLKSLTESLRVAKERLDAGSAVKTDVLNLEVKLAQAQEDLIKARNGVELGSAALNTAIGSDFVTPDKLAEPDREKIPEPQVKASDDVISARPELKAAVLANEISRKSEKIAAREYLPVVSAFASSDWDSEDGGKMESSYVFGAMVELNIFDGFRTRAALKSARASAKAAAADEERMRKELLFDVKQGYLGMKEAWERMGVARKSVASADEAFRITMERYEKGSADITELMGAEVGLTATRTRDVGSLYDYLVARSNYERAMGMLALKYGGSSAGTEGNR